MAELDELLKRFPKVISTKPRPSQVTHLTAGEPMTVPESWLVFVAPRPLAGSLVTLKRDWLCGCVWRDTWCYAAIDPEDPWAANWIESNRRDKASLMVYMSEAEVMQKARQALLAQYPGEVSTLKKKRSVGTLGAYRSISPPLSCANTYSGLSLQRLPADR